MKKTREQIHYNMSRVRNKDSKIELTLRKALWAKGYRYRKNVGDVFGKPDIVFKGRKVAVFCDSEFWHGYDWEERCRDFKSNQEFWLKKIERNIQRDSEVNKHLRNDGWTVIRFWGRDIIKNTDECVETIEKAVKKNNDI